MKKIWIATIGALALLTCVPLGLMLAAPSSEAGHAAPAIHPGDHASAVTPANTLRTREGKRSARIPFPVATDTGLDARLFDQQLDVPAGILLAAAMVDQENNRGPRRLALGATDSEISPFGNWLSVSGTLIPGSTARGAGSSQPVNHRFPAPGGNGGDTAGPSSAGEDPALSGRVPSDPRENHAPPGHEGPPGWPDNEGSHGSPNGGQDTTDPEYVTSVPEPSPFMLFFIGLALVTLGALVHRRQA